MVLAGEFPFLTISVLKAGDPLIRFDRDVIAKAGYDDIVIMAVTNSPEYPQMKKEPDQPVVAGETPIVIF